MKNILHKHKRGVLIVISFLFVIACSTGYDTYMEYNRYELKNNIEPIVLELMQEWDSSEIKVEDYILANEEKLEKTTVDISEVDISKVGSYFIYFEYEEEKIAVEIIVEDTVSPTILPTDCDTEYELSVDTSTITITAADYIQAITDFSEVEITLRCVETGEEIVGTTLEDLILLHNEGGNYTYIIEVKDASENIETYEFSTNISYDYSSFIRGIEDYTIYEGEDVDLSCYLSYDLPIIDVTIDDSSLNTNVAGNYTITYTFTSIDDYTFNQTSTVTVKEYIDYSQYFTIEGNVSETTLQSALSYWNMLPDALIQKFNDAGWELIITTKSISGNYYSGTVGEGEGNIVGVCDYQGKFIAISSSSVITIVHEMGHFLDYVSGWSSYSNEFTEIYENESNSYVSYGYDVKAHILANHKEYMAGVFSTYILYPSRSYANTPLATAFIANLIEQLNLNTTYLN